MGELVFNDMILVLLLLDFCCIIGMRYMSTTSSFTTNKSKRAQFSSPPSQLGSEAKNIDIYQVLEKYGYEVFICDHICYDIILNKVTKA